MKTKNFILKLMGTTVLLVFFASCSSNEDSLTSKNEGIMNRSAPPIVFSKHRGTLTITNNTHHDFEHLVFRCFQTATNHSLDQEIKINNFSTVTLSNYHDTFTLGITQNDSDKWSLFNYSTLTNEGNVFGIDASDLSNPSNYMTTYYITNEEVSDTMSSVYWSSVGDNRSRDNDNHVYFRFKFYDEISTDILVNDNQTWTSDGLNYFYFTTTATFDDDGNTTITLNENSL